MLQFVVFYIIFSFCFVFPPSAFVAVGKFYYFIIFKKYWLFRYDVKLLYHQKFMKYWLVSDLISLNESYNNFTINFCKK